MFKTFYLFLFALLFSTTGFANPVTCPFKYSCERTIAVSLKGKDENTAKRECALALIHHHLSFSNYKDLIGNVKAIIPPTIDFAGKNSTDFYAVDSNIKFIGTEEIDYEIQTEYEAVTGKAYDVLYCQDGNYCYTIFKLKNSKGDIIDKQSYDYNSPYRDKYCEL
jgi:hypothetical protein